MATKRDLNGWSDERSSFPSLEEFLDSELPEGLISIEHNGLTIDILNRPDEKSDVTIVLFHAALSPRVTTLPLFTGIGITGDVKASKVWISDPSLYLNSELKLAWFSGNDRQELQQVLFTILSHVFSSHGSKSRIFFGPSGGGFAALYYSQQFPGSLAIAVNPQTILANYTSTQVEEYTRVCFGAESKAESDAVLSRIESDMRIVYGHGQKNTIAYVQNSLDTHHVYRHLKHFLIDTPRMGEFYLFMDNWGPGHVAPPTEFMASLIARMVDSAPDWGVVLGESGFLHTPTFDDVLEWKTEISNPSS